MEHDGSQVSDKQKENTSTQKESSNTSPKEKK